jgi:membrane fusion protein, copper/silver efflux system
MPTPVKALVVVILGAAVFLAGYAAHQSSAPTTSSSPGQRTATYSCPMHPQYTSDHSGDCPICGMRLEQVADGDARVGSDSAGLNLPGMVVIGAARQQLIGVRTDAVRVDSSSQVLRVPGRIAVDDQRLHRIVVAAEGWIVSLGENTVGSFVRKNQLLASYYHKELLYNERLFLLSIPANEQLAKQTKDFSLASIRTAGSANPQFPIDSLRGLGMNDLQIEELQRTRVASPQINIYSPISGYVLARNISPTQWFDKGSELYRIADISRVWVMVDIFEKDRQFLTPGAEATVLYEGRRLTARMSDALPQFDADSRTLKARFELDNPDHLLQPDMFVDVELTVKMPAAITVPADAVFDSGLRKIVFVDRGEGKFEARRVQTGWRLGDRIEIVRGLMEDERIVASATFLLDSESRMKAAVAGIFNPETDPVCGMEVDRDRARAAGQISVQDGVDYYFCSDNCKKKFDADAAQYLHAAHGMPSGPAPASPATSEAVKTAMPKASKMTMPDRAAAMQVSTGATMTEDPVCGMNVDPTKASDAGLKLEHAGNTYFFCSKDCKEKFAANPDRYLTAQGGGR